MPNLKAHHFLLLHVFFFSIPRDGSWDNKAFVSSTVVSFFFFSSRSLLCAHPSLPPDCDTHLLRPETTPAAIPPPSFDPSLLVVCRLSCRRPDTPTACLLRTEPSIVRPRAHAERRLAFDKDRGGRSGDTVCGHGRISHRVAAAAVTVAAQPARWRQRTRRRDSLDTGRVGRWKG